MIVQSLCRYYDILANDEEVGISRPGYGQAKVSFALVVSKQGELTNILDPPNRRKKTNTKNNGGSISKLSYCGDHTVSPFFATTQRYVFGVE